MDIGYIGSLGWTEILLIAAIILLLFGARRVPDLARSLGKSLSEFKKGRTEGEKEKIGEKAQEDDKG